MSDHDDLPMQGVLMHAIPQTDACDHKFSGWRMFDDGNGGEQVCERCGIGAMAATMWADDWE